MTSCGGRKFPFGKCFVIPPTPIGPALLATPICLHISSCEKSRPLKFLQYKCFPSQGRDHSVDCANSERVFFRVRSTAAEGGPCHISTAQQASSDRGIAIMSVTIKAYLMGKDDVHKEIRRFVVDQDDNFDYLSKKVADVFSNLRNIGFQMYYRGEFQMSKRFYFFGDIYVITYAYQIVFINLPCSLWCLFIYCVLCVYVFSFYFWRQDPSLLYVVQ